MEGRNGNGVKQRKLRSGQNVRWVTASTELGRAQRPRGAAFLRARQREEDDASDRWGRVGSGSGVSGATRRLGQTGSRRARSVSDSAELVGWNPTVDSKSDGPRASRLGLSSSLVRLVGLVEPSQKGLGSVKWVWFRSEFKPV